MNRPFDEELISAYLDDELSAEERSDVERLLAERPEARRLLEELRGIRDGLQLLPAYRLKEDFGAAVLRQAEREMLRTPTPPTATSPAVTTPPVLPVPIAAAHDGGGSRISPASLTEHNWRRPAAWSVLAVAAALVLMYVERQRHDAQPLVMNTKTGAGPQPKAAGKLEMRKETDGVMHARTESTDKLATDRDAAADAGRMMLKGGEPMAKPGLPPAVVTAPTVAGATTPPGHQLAIVNSVPPNAAPQVAPPATPSPLANQILGGGAGGGGYGPPAAAAPRGNNAVDMTPLIATNDYNRARSLVAEYEEVRRDVVDEKLAVETLSRRIQSPQLQAKVGDFSQQQLRGGQAAPSDQLLIVQCDITPEALERGLAPILVRENIADLTAVQELQQAQSQVSLNFAGGTLPAAQELMKAQREAGAVGRSQQVAPEQAGAEAYYYVVADAKQLEATLDALRRQSDYFVNVRVEPAPADARQQAWRSYNRNQDVGGRYAVPTVVSPAIAQSGAVPNAAKVGPSLGGTANAPVVAAKPAAEPATAAIATKKLGENDSEQKTLLKNGNESEGIAKSNNVAKQVDQPLPFGGGNSVAGTAVPTAPAATQPTAAPAAPGNGLLGLAQQAPPGSGGGGLAGQQGGYGQSMQNFYNDSRQVTPLSRAQRLSRSDVAAPPTQRPSEEVPTNAAAQTNGERLPAKAAAAGEKAPPAQPGGAPASQVAASTTPAPASRPTPADDAASKAKDEQSKNTADTRARDLATEQQLGDVAQQKRTAGRDEPVWYGLPPDYHEALFIFRVVNDKPAAATPAGSAPAKK